MWPLHVLMAAVIVVNDSLHQMGWSRAGAQQLLHVKTAIINGRLDRYTRHHSVPADIAA